MDSHQPDTEVSLPATPDRVLSFNVETFPSEDAWLEARRNGLGASDAASVLGLSRKSPLALYHEKLGLELDESREQRIRLLKMGHLMEPVIAGLFGEEVKAVGVREPPARFHLERSTLYPWLTCTVDRWGRDTTLPVDSLGAAAHPTEYIAEQAVVIELKNVSVFAASDWLDAGEVPLEYQVQVQHQLAVTGLKRGYIACTIGGIDFKWAPVERDDSFIAVLLQMESQFWDRLKAGEPPPADYLDSTRETLVQLRKQAKIDETKVIELPTEFIALREEHDSVEAQLTALKLRKEHIENQVRDYLVKQGAQFGTLRDGRGYSWKMQQRTDPVRTEPRTIAFPVLRRTGKVKGSTPVASN